MGGWRRQKFNNQRTLVDGIKFASQKEALRWIELQTAEWLGEITNLSRQVRFSIDIGDAHICDYVADYVYDTPEGNVVEDSKGALTDVYKLKRRLMFVVHGITILETGRRVAKKRTKSRAKTSKKS